MLVCANVGEWLDLSCRKTKIIDVVRTKPSDVRDGVPKQYQSALHHLRCWKWQKIVTV